VAMDCAKCAMNPDVDCADIATQTEVIIDLFICLNRLISLILIMCVCNLCE